jgi:DNA-binding MarR family transcriptional regulator
MQRWFFRQLAARGVDTRCAADLLKYFQRHPSIYITTSELAVRVGYSRGDIEAAISSLTRAGLLVERRRHHTCAAVLYRLVAEDWLSELAQAASSVRGRRQLRTVLRSRELCRRAAVVTARAEANLGRSATVLETIGARRAARLTAGGGTSGSASITRWASPPVIGRSRTRP